MPEIGQKKTISKYSNAMLSTRSTGKYNQKTSKYN